MLVPFLMRFPGILLAGKQPAPRLLSIAYWTQIRIGS